jgi:predicted DNA-binding transcriptional regulator AlpA
MKREMNEQEWMPDRLWTSKETANFLGIAISTLYQLTYKGTGPRCYKVGKYRRFKPLEVLAWLNAHAIQGTA